ncbi:MAG: hypothetical protein WBA44_15235 [Mesorhizobium sp.]
MHILIIIVGILIAGAAWWYRLKMMRDAAGEAADAIGRVRGKIRRNKIRRLNEQSPLTAIDDPVIAAATLIAGISGEDVALSPAREQMLRNEIAAIADPSKAEEAVIYAQWAADQIDDATTVIDKLGPYLAARLNDGEKADLIAMVRKVATEEGPLLPSLELRMRRLRQKLGLEIR